MKPSDNVAEWSKVPDSSSGGEIRVGSNPTVVMQCTAKWIACLPAGYSLDVGAPRGRRTKDDRGEKGGGPVMGRRALCVAPYQRVRTITEISIVHVFVTVGIRTIIRLIIAITIVSLANTTTISPSESPPPSSTNNHYRYHHHHHYH